MLQADSHFAFMSLWYKNDGRRRVRVAVGAQFFMSERGWYGRRVAEHSGIRSPDSVRALSSRTNGTVATLLELPERGSDRTLPTPTSEGFLLSVPFRGLYEREAWLDGARNSHNHAIGPGTFSFMDLRQSTSLLFHSPFSLVQYYIPRRALDDVSDELASTRICEFPIPVLSCHEDPILQALTESILPSFEVAEVASPLYVDSVLRATSVHLATTYGNLSPLTTLTGGLAAWQQRRIGELLDANLAGDVSLSELASECGVSTSHFTRAFRKSFGVAPYQYLIERRVQRSKDLLANSALSLSQIAITCGFSDQSHFTRVFNSRVGATPGQWRKGGSAPADAHCPAIGLPA